MRSIPVDKLRELSRYLDEFPTLMPGDGDLEYWRLLIQQLPRRMYSKAQVEEFARELEMPSGSPSLRLLYDMREKGVTLEQFKVHLETIRCHKALNIFTPTKIPVFTEHPQQVVHARAGETVFLQCAVDCVPSPPIYQWFYNRTPLVGEKASQLVLRNIHHGHKGLYCCRATNPHINDEKTKHVFSNFAELSINQYPIQESKFPSGSSPSRPAPRPIHHAPTQPASTHHVSTQPANTTHSTSVIVRDPVIDTVDGSDIEVIKQPSGLTCHYDKPFTLECEARSRLGRTLNYQWIKTKPGKESMISSGPTLQMTWSRAEILCIYCRISSDAGEVIETEQAEVKVTTIWFTEQPQKHITGQSGQRVYLTCKADGKQPINYIWFKSNNKKDVKKFVATNSTGVYHMPSPTVHDTGYYTCQAEVQGEFVSSDTAYVRIRNSQKDFHITRQPRSHVCVPGESLTLSCEAVGNPSYLWYHNDTPLYGKESANLHISEVTEVAFGTYKCRLTNSGDQEFTRTVRVMPGLVDPEDSTHGISSTQSRQTQAEFEFKTGSGEYYARDKVALLIGNQDYDNERIANLTSPINDITQLKATLEELEFKVFAFANLDSEETVAVLGRFCELLVDAGMYAVFYYAGHGFEHQNVDYIIPIDAQHPLKCDQCFSVKYVESMLQETRSKVFMFLDCCRVNYDSKVEGPSKPVESCGFHNLYKVLSCVSHQPAFEKASDECSVFNKALRKGLLTAGKDLEGVITDMMMKEGRSKSGSVYQRPVFVHRLVPRDITLREEIMWDSKMSESDMIEVENTWDLTHCVPHPLDLSTVSQWVSGSVKFQMTLSNVMVVNAEYKARAGCMQALLTLDTAKLRDMKLVALRIADEEGKVTYRITDLQKHCTGTLELHFRVSVVTGVPGEEKQANIEVEHKLNKFIAHN